MTYLLARRLNMGAFVLGILIGWLAEWVFYTYWVKAGETDEDCAALKKELELKNRQISSLQAQLHSTPTSSQAKSSNSNQSKQNNTVALKTASTSSKKTSSNTQTTATKSKTKPKSKTSPATKKTKTAGDDFTKLSGIGPSMSATLKTLGIDTFEKLAATDDDVLRKMLEDSGARMNNNKDVMDSWNEQAILASKGDFATLKKMQQALKK